MKNRTNLALVLVAIICVFDFCGLPVESAEGEGHNDFVFLLPTAEDGNGLYNQNDNSKNVRTLESGGVKFKIPSYASGIMDITKPQFDGLPEAEKPSDNGVPLPNLDLLPPLDDGEPNRPNPTSNEIPGSTTQKSVQYAFPTGGSNVGSRIGEDNSYDLPLDLLPPLPSEDKTKNYKPALPNQPPPRGPATTTTATLPAKPSLPEQNFGATFSFSGPSTVRPSPTVPTSATVTPTKPSQPEQRFGSTFNFNTPTTASSKTIYTGGFGGAPGILGNQKKPGYAVRPDGSIRDPDQQKKPTTPKPFGPVVTTRPPPPPVVRPVAPVTEKPVANKYTGSFGGPPGFLTPFDRVVPVAAKTST